MKREKKLFILGLLLFFIPIVYGLLNYSELPAKIPTHFNVDNVADKYSSKNFALFGLPAIMAGIYIFSYFFMKLDPKQKNQSQKIRMAILFSLPILTTAAVITGILYAKGQRFNIGRLVNLLLAVLFIIVGNYLPKTKRNYTMGIKIPWTLDSDENWFKTHRLAGMLFALAGIILFILNIISYNIGSKAMLPLILMASIIPTIYSLLLYKKQNR